LSKKTKVLKHHQTQSAPTPLKKLFWNFVGYAVLVCVLSSAGLWLLLQWLPAPTSTFMMYRHYEDLVNEQTFKAIDYRWVSAKNISPSATVAVIAAEDQQFFRHSGFDLPSIESSINVYLNGGRLRGASTISQQVAKNLFLTPSKSLVRKGLEVWFTLLIEWLWSKERILEMYLNVAEFGDHIFGIEAASQRYFNIPARQLSKAQAALLAATLPNPIRFQALRPSSYVLKRQHWILGQIQNIGYNMHSILK
jgi:monofunctional glycosyltransferase